MSANVCSISIEGNSRMRWTTVLANRTGKPSSLKITSNKYPQICHNVAGCNKKGFTLIELLLVISIIALLLAILIPSLRKVRLQAKIALCASNQHQILLALGGYQAENDSKLPPSSQGDFAPCQLKVADAPPVIETLGKFLPEIDAVICPVTPLKTDEKNVVFDFLTPREAYRTNAVEISGNYSW